VPDVAGPLRDCALLFALPLTREDYDAAVRGECLADYGSQLGADPDRIWDTKYARAAASGIALGKEAERMGAQVYWRANLNAISDASRHCRCLVIFAHMTGAYYRADQILDLEGVRARVADRAGPLQEWNAYEGSDVEHLVDALNSLIERRALLGGLPDMLKADGLRSPARGQALCRDQVDVWLEGLVEPGNRIELFDGLHSPFAFSAAVAPGFHGEIDLATCSLTVIAAVVEMERGFAITFSARAALTVPRPEFVATQKALRLFAVAQGSYLDCRAKIAAIIDEERG
jgi:hypothetical protein